MSQALARESIRATVASVPDIGNVYDYERYQEKWSTYLSLFTTTINGLKQIRAWTVGVAAYPSRYTSPGGRRGVTRTLRFKVRGYMGWSDELQTEKTFAELVETVANYLDASTSLHSGHYTGLGQWEGPPAVVDRIEPHKWGTALCHFAEITQELEELK